MFSCVRSRGRTRNSHGPHGLEGVCDSYVDTDHMLPEGAVGPGRRGLLGLEPPGECLSHVPGRSCSAEVDSRTGGFSRGEWPSQGGRDPGDGIGVWMGAQRPGQDRD